MPLWLDELERQNPAGNSRRVAGARAWTTISISMGTTIRCHVEQLAAHITAQTVELCRQGERVALYG
jgi:hypothetical protein